MSNIKIKKGYLINEDGAVAVVAAMMLPVLLGLGALAVDASVWFMSERDLQTAADAGALAAAYEIANGDASNA